MSNIADLAATEPRSIVPVGFGRRNPRQLRSARLQSAPARRFRFFVLFVCAGYLVQGRTFAYLGIPGFYAGEALLLWTALKRKVGWWETLLSEFRANLLLSLGVISFLAWGVIETLRGLLGGYSIEDSVRGLSTHYYPLLFYVGLSAARYLSFDVIRQYFNQVNVLVGLAAVATTVANGRYHFGWALPWKQDVLVPGAPALPCLAFVLAVAFARRIDARLVTSALFAMLAMLLGTRSSILGSMAGLFILLCRPKRRALTATLLVGAAVTFGIVSALLPALLPDFGGRAGALTPARITARVTAIFDRNLASKIATDGGEDDSFIQNEAGTTEWRRKFWLGVIDSLATPSDWILGHGYGFSLGSLKISGVSGSTEVLRTPHNFAIYLLGYTGLAGCVLYVCVLLALIAEVARCPDSPIRDGLLAGGLSVLVMAASGNLLETPFGAIPTYLAMGMLLGLARKWKPAVPGRWSRKAGIQPLPYS